ncbi:unnamed protein product [Blepharisma stoltei]|uniref:Uncharacterized protein n=1 Tax=Blepharisma stoltei TaxID=1481888 RepID=A0AAU9IFS2_9CILI|nr:unnamed protein product [Blepharisma stoltei]
MFLYILIKASPNTSSLVFCSAGSLKHLFNLWLSIFLRTLIIWVTLSCVWLLPSALALVFHRCKLSLSALFDLNTLRSKDFLYFSTVLSSLSANSPIDLWVLASFHLSKAIFGAIFILIAFIARFLKTEDCLSLGPIIRSLHFLKLSRGCFWRISLTTVAARFLVASSVLSFCLSRALVFQ